MNSQDHRPHQDADTSTDQRPRQWRVLVAEDTAPLRRMLVRALSLFGCEVYGVGEATQVEAAVAEFAPDVVLLDWHLGAVSPTATLEGLRRRGLPVIIMTGDPGSVAAPGVPVLAKPINMQRLRLEIEEFGKDA